jgi:hypothetical protein
MDIVVDTKVIMAYLMGSDTWTLGDEFRNDAVWRDDGLEVLWFEGLDHGQVFAKKSTRRQLVQIVRDFCED